LNIHGQQFVFEREPRDVESAAIIRECAERGLGIRTPVGRLGVWLDSPMIEELEGPGAVERELPAKYMQFIRYGIDIRKEPMLIYPTLHYQNGGIKINPLAETEVPGLYAAGETTGGVQGENRLMGNSLLDILVFGHRAGVNAAKYVREEGSAVGEPKLDHVREYVRELEAAGVERNRIAPMILPDYTTDDVRKRQLTAHYVGTLR
jgi:succinate dehydrogenase/fumarate reductase flavoprotein subunit